MNNIVINYTLPLKKIKRNITVVMAPALKSHFETTINLKQNNLNFGVTIYLKSRHGAKPAPYSDQCKTTEQKEIH